MMMRQRHVATTIAFFWFLLATCRPMIMPVGSFTIGGLPSTTTSNPAGNICFNLVLAPCDQAVIKFLEFLEQGGIQLDDSELSQSTRLDPSREQTTQYWLSALQETPGLPQRLWGTLVTPVAMRLLQPTLRFILLLVSAEARWLHRELPKYVQSRFPDLVEELGGPPIAVSNLSFDRVPVVFLLETTNSVASLELFASNATESLQNKTVEEWAGEVRGLLHHSANKAGLPCDDRWEATFELVGPRRNETQHGEPKRSSRGRILWYPHSAPPIWTFQLDRHCGNWIKDNRDNITSRLLNRSY